MGKNEKYAIKQLIKSGADKNRLLALTDGKVLSDDNLDDMHHWNLKNVNVMDAWVRRLEDYHVYFQVH